MHQTLFDEYITTCTANIERLPVCLHMLKAIRETQPVAHKFDHKANTYRLPHQPIKWPDAAMCLFTPHGMGGDPYYRFCVDVGYDHKELNSWFKDQKWVLYGALLFQPNDNEFEIIPLVKIIGHMGVVVAEIQLHFTLTDAGWTWTKAKTGPVNALFHEVMISLIPKDMHERIDQNIYALGYRMTDLLAAYHAYLQTPGKWHIHPAHQAKGKVKNGKLVKIYRPATVGYKEYLHDN